MTNAPALSATISPQESDFLRASLKAWTGITIGSERNTLLASRLVPLVAAYGTSDIAGLVRQLRIGDRQLQIDVINALTTNETSFFRDAPIFSDLVDIVIPELMRGLADNQPLTVWCGASSSGQEIYTFAIQLHRRHPGLVKEGRIRLLATDISTEMVDRTREGVYTDLEIARGLPVELRDRYFTRVGKMWKINRDISELVLCRQLNLIESLSPVPRCDLVLLRNVLIYFEDAVKTKILTEIKESILQPDGALIIGASEMLGAAGVHYRNVDYPNSVGYMPR